MSIIKKGSLSVVSGKRFALLAPVKESYLNHAAHVICPDYKKVSFGTDKDRELLNIRKLYLTQKSIGIDTYVYLYANGMIKYKGKLIDEFLFFEEKKKHPHPCGAWNVEFKSYYTVTEIEGCGTPLESFRLYKSESPVANIRRPLCVVDPE